MITYEEIKDKPATLRSFTGLDKPEFERLLKVFEGAWEEYIKEQYIEGKERKREYGGGRKARLREVEDKLLFIVFYYKTYPLQEVIGFLFDLSQSQANEWIHTLSEVLRRALGKENQLPERDPQHLQEVLGECPELAFIIDGTERRRQRPVDKEEQKSYYSGKKN